MRKSTLAAVVIVMSLVSGIAGAVDGVIHFRGEFVDPACSLGTNGNQFGYSCYTSSEKVRISTGEINLDKLGEFTRLPRNQGTVLVKNVNQDKNLKLVVVSYN